MEFRAARTHVGITLVGADNDVASLSNAEVGTSHTCVSRQELVAEAEACPISKERGVVIALLIADALLLKQLAHVIVTQVDGWHDDVARCLPLQLDNPFAEVGLHHFDTTFLKIRIHTTLFCEHRLRLHHLLHVMVLQDVIDNLVELLCILCPMHLHAVLFSCSGKLIEVFIQMGDGVTLDGTGLFAQLFPFVESISHVVALGADSPERGIVPVGIFLVFQELLCCFAM